MGRRKVDRSDKVIQSFESTKPLKQRLTILAAENNTTVSAVIRKILEKHFEERSQL